MLWITSIIIRSNDKRTDESIVYFPFFTILSTGTLSLILYAYWKKWLWTHVFIVGNGELHTPPIIITHLDKFHPEFHHILFENNRRSHRRSESFWFVGSSTHNGSIIKENPRRFICISSYSFGQIPKYYSFLESSDQYPYHSGAGFPVFRFISGLWPDLCVKK